MRPSPSAAALDSPRAQVRAWAASGAMALTGPPDGPVLGPPDGLVTRLEEVAGVLRGRSHRLGRHVEVEPLTLLAERAAIAGHRRQGTTSCGGATRLLRTRDGWLALSLARPDDVELLPAWLGCDIDERDPWPGVADAVRTSDGDELDARGGALGLPVARLPAAPPAVAPAPAPLAPLPIAATCLGEEPPGIAGLDGVRVVDLSALWAGPLCGSLLADAGAEVVKVESTARPDGARSGPTEFFDVLNAGKRSVALDLRTPDGRTALHRLTACADVVIEASRPRALAQLGIDAASLLRSGRTRVWVSITGHGRVSDGALRVGFGDDAAVAGGLVSWFDGAPCFTADAVADPTTGLVAAAAVLDALAAGGRWLLDVAMADVAAHLAGPTLTPEGHEAVAAPRARPVTRHARPLGADTAAVLDALPT